MLFISHFSRVVLLRQLRLTLCFIFNEKDKIIAATSVLWEEGTVMGQ